MNERRSPVGKARRLGMPTLVVAIGLAVNLYGTVRGWSIPTSGPTSEAIVGAAVVAFGLAWLLAVGVAAAIHQRRAR